MAVRYQGGKAAPAGGPSNVDRILYEQIYQSIFRHGGPAASLDSIVKSTLYSTTGENGAALKKQNPQLLRALLMLQEANMAMRDARRH